MGFMVSKVTVRTFIDGQMEHAVDEEVGTQSTEWLTAMRLIDRLYSDGGVFRPRGCEAGSWAWVGVDSSGRRVALQYGCIEASERLPVITNNLTEFAAMLRALESVAEVVPGWGGKMCSDSGVTIGRFRDGWKTEGIPGSWLRRMQDVLWQLGDVTYILHKGHPTAAEITAGVGMRKGKSGERAYPVSHHQVMCDRLCNRVMNEWGQRMGAVRGR